jgi:hypothetical protein
MSSIKRETTRKKSAKKGASKKKGASEKKGAVKRKKGVSKKKSATSGQRLLARDMSSATASLMRTTTAWRADTRRRRKEEVPGYDPGVWDIPGHFEEAAKALKIWPFYRGADAKPFECLRAQTENDPIFYDGGRKVHAGPHNAYLLASECR